MPSVNTKLLHRKVCLPEQRTALPMPPDARGGVWASSTSRLPFRSASTTPPIQDQSATITISFQLWPPHPYVSDTLYAAHNRITTLPVL